MQPEQQAAAGPLDVGIGTAEGARRASAPRRRWLWLLAVALVAALLVSGGGYVFAQRLQSVVVTRFSSAQAHLERARTLVAGATGAQAAASLGRARAEFASARDDFAAAGAAVGPARLVPSRLPLAGPRVAAVEHLSAMGLALCDAGLISIDIDAQFLGPARPGQPTGTARLLGILNAAQAALPTLRRDLDRARDEVAAVDLAAVPGSQRTALRKARDDIAKGITGVAELERIIPAIGDVLAVNGRRTYIVEQVNPFELRAGGGYIGTYSLLVADHGNLSVLRSGDTHELPDYNIMRGDAGYIAPPGAMSGLLGAKSWSFQDSNFYPDFRDDGKAVAQFAQRDFGTGVDGVIAIDLYAVAALLGVTGPITAPGTSGTLTKDNVIATIMAGDLIDDPAHKRVISSVAGPLMQKLVALDSGQWLGLIQVFNQLATQRHLQLFFTSTSAQTEMERLGLAGGLSFAGHDDFLNLGEANFGGNKANYFLTRQLDLALSRSGDVLHHTLTEDLTLNLTSAPPGYVVPYDFAARLLLPANATGVQVSGVTRTGQPSMAVPAGTTLVEGSASLQTDASHVGHLRVVYAWDTPWPQDAAGAHQLYWEKQPGVAQDAISVTWSDGGAAASAKSDLGTDRLLTLTPSRIEVAQGNAAQVSLPRL